MSLVTETTVPDQSALQPSLSSADFYDAYEAPLRNGTLTPTEIFLVTSRATPRWVAAYRVGDRLGIFSIFAKTEKELLLGIDDRHLDVRVSVLKSERNGLPNYVVSTVVHVHNWLGHAYMAPVGRIHPLVVKAMMRRAVV